MTPSIPPLDQLTMATARATEHTGTIVSQDHVLAAAGAGVLALGARYVARLVKADGDQQGAMHQRLVELEQAEAHREETVDRLATNLTELHSQWRECERHRAEQGRAIQQLTTDLQALKSRIEPGT